ncbi:hypothetical protein KJZ99_00475 [bacterium]|nr:hypothetical protein [bacterium]
MIFLVFLFVSCSQALAGGSIFGAQPTGDPLHTGGVRSVGLGGAGLAIWDSLGIHSDNSAQMGALSGTMLRAGMFTGLYNSTEGSNGDTDSEFGWQSFRLYLRLHPRYRTALGIDPIRRSDVRVFGIDTLFYESGGEVISEPYESRMSWQGSGVDIRWDHAIVVSSKLSIGATAGFLTEHLEVISDLDFPEATNGARDASFRDVQRFSGFWGGASVHIRATERLSLGGFWRSKASGDFAYESAVNHGGNPVLQETSGDRPGAYGVGVGYQWHRLWSLFADVRQQSWSKAEFGPMYAASTLRGIETTSIMLGIERKGGTRITDEGFDRWDFRAGLAHRLQPWQLESSQNDVTETAIALGTSLPLSQQAGKLHFALEMGRREPQSLDVSENYVRFYMQMDMHERWFQRKRRTLDK